ncbi:hypothetical protein F9B74_09680 [Pelistega sp. NLN82]|uniref:Uncharacterized protein n=1 Tax=Pelistega ratti TaxID=2652177 RepID=A0A6L9Y8F2_9BURK|nr:hypothetical protein [Pelistega ratti]NEN76573.1 hypothetical protein [Pelistega ratti]
MDNAGYLNVFSRAIGKKIIECNHNIENVTLNILNNIDVLNKKNQEIDIEIDIEIDKKQNYKVISSLFLIYLSILFEKGRLNSQENLNDALKEIFGQVSSNKILNLCLCDTQNLSTTPKLKFDFSDLEIENFYIKDYNEFFNCIFNEKTLFKNGKISFSSYEKRKNYPFNKNHFINCQFSSSMEELLNNISDSSENKKKNKEKILFDFVRKFHDSGRFKPKKQSEIRAKQGQYVDAMLEAGIIIPHDKTKLNEPEYIINPEYDDDLLESLNNNAVNMNIRRMLKNIKL